jgi:hypothetical protein
LSRCSVKSAPELQNDFDQRWTSALPRERPFREGRYVGVFHAELDFQKPLVSPAERLAIVVRKLQGVGRRMSRLAQVNVRRQVEEEQELPAVSHRPDHVSVTGNWLNVAPG